MKLFTSSEAARRLGISRMALYRWLVDGKIEPPAFQPGSTKRWWSDADIANVARARKAFVPRKGGGRPRKVVDAARITNLRAQGAPWSEIARQLGCCAQTARRAL